MISKLIFCLALITYPFTAHSQNSNVSVTGLIKNGGTGVDRTTYLRQKIHSGSQQKKSLSYAFCSGGLQTKIKQLEGMLLKVTGSLKTKSGKKFSCFAPGKFEILKMSSGRPPLIGILGKVNQNYVIKTDHGVTVTLDSQSGLDQYLDKKMILDVKPPPPVPDGVKAMIATFLPHP